jgi:signal recognition particle receptor subunit beta
VRLDRLQEVLAAAGYRLTPRELAELTWLAGHLPAAPPQPAVPRDPRPDPPEPAEPLPERAEPAEVPPAETADRVPVYSVPAVPESTVDDALSTRVVRVRTSGVLAPALGMVRALRSLKRVAPSANEVELDERATAERYAECGRWLPVLRPVFAPWRDLVLVVDRGPSSVLWTELAEELHLILQRLGAFGTIRLRYLCTGADGRLGLASTPAGRSLRRPAELIDPAGRQIVLVLSDCVGAVWQSAELHEALARWGRSGPLAILQPLPERLWGRTNLPPIRGRLRGPAPAAPNDRLSFQGYQQPWRSVPDGAVPVPVLEIAPDWLHSWAQLVTGAAPHGVDGVVAVVGAGQGPDPVPPAPADLAPLDRVARFRAEATPEAFRLAGYLAAAPLSHAVMRVVQAAMLPGSRLSHLAEVWFSGLLTPRGAVYEFVPGTRDVLLETLRKHEVEEVVDRVSTFLERHADRGGATFLAAVPAPDGAQRLPALSRPFARVRDHALARATGTVRVEEAPGPLVLSGSALGVSSTVEPGSTALSEPGSFALLIGVDHFADPELPDLPPASVELSELGATLIESCGLPPDRLRIVLNPDDPAPEIEEAARRASATLLLYYYGHGVVGPDGELRLATTGGAVPYETLQAVLDARNVPSLAILDCRFAQAALARPLRRGYVLTPGPDPDPHTNHGGFTRGLATVLRDGHPEARPTITPVDLSQVLTGALHPPLIDYPPAPLVLALNRARPRATVPVPSARTVSAKIVVAGGFGSGKDTFIGSLSEITPLTTEAVMTSAAEGLDDTSHIPNKVTTTVAMDFGRITIDRDLILYLFGTPGQSRFWFLWDELVRGAIGAVVLVDTRRLADCFAAVDFFETRRLPFILGINCFDGVQDHGIDEVRNALALDPDVPILLCDARRRESTKQVVVALIEHVITMRRERSDAEDLVQ